MSFMMTNGFLKLEKNEISLILRRTISNQAKAKNHVNYRMFSLYPIKWCHFHCKKIFGKIAKSWWVVSVFYNKLSLILVCQVLRGFFLVYNIMV